MGSSIRLTGMASGLDTDSMVEQLMNVEKQSYYKAQRTQYLTEYKIEKYREVTTKLTDFNSKYLDSLSSTNMKSATFFRKFKTSFTSSKTQSTSNAVSITSTSEANAGTHKVTIKQVAQAASVTGVKSTGTVKLTLPGHEGETLSFEQGSKLKLYLDGKTREIDISGDYESEEAFKNALQDKIKDTFGTGYDGTNGKINVDINNGVLSLTTINGASNMNIADPGSLTIINGSNELSTSKSLEDLVNSFNTPLQFGHALGDGDGDEADQIAFKINGKEFNFDKTATLKDIMNEINNDDEIGVTIKFNNITGQFSMTTDKVGADERLELEDVSGNLFESLGLTDAAATRTEGQDTLAMVDGIEVVRASKTFTVDGITYQANEVTAEGEEITVNLDIDTDKVFEDIKTFVKDYNEIVDYLQKLVDEKYDRSFQPLTDDERSEMTEDEIKKWDEKAKTGLLHNDSTIRSLLNSLRSTFSGTVEGVGTTFSDIGIKTGTYTNGGKIILDDDGANKLKEAISNKLDDVVALFTQKSSKYGNASSRQYSFDEKTTRKNQEGLMNRMFDTLEDYISTYRDANNAKGQLIEKAGKIGDTSETTSVLSKQLIQNTKKVQELLDKVNAKYDKYYKQFSALETAMNKLNSQNTYISQLLGGSGM